MRQQRDLCPALAVSLRRHFQRLSCTAPTRPGFAGAAHARGPALTFAGVRCLLRRSIFLHLRISDRTPRLAPSVVLPGGGDHLLGHAFCSTSVPPATYHHTYRASVALSIHNLPDDGS